MLAILMFGCNANDLSPASLVDRTRVLGVKATPAEPQPGDSVRLRALAVDPVDGIQAVIWFGCLVEDSSSFGCDELEFIGQTVEGGQIPSFSTPADLLDDLSAEEQEEGRNYLVQFQAVPNGVDFEAIAAGEETGQDLSELGEAGFKRVPVSLAALPNDNPRVTGIRVEGYEQALTDGDTVILQAGETYTFEPLLSEDSIQEYTYVNSEGVLEDRVEEPYFSFFATYGTFDQAIALHPTVDFEFTAPVDPEVAEGSLWVVVRDRRGGMDWQELKLRVE
jgi:hypothetical protein